MNLHPLVTENNVRLTIFVGVEGTVKALPVGRSYRAIRHRGECSVGSIAYKDLCAAALAFSKERREHIEFSAVVMNLRRPEIPFSPKTVGIFENGLALAPNFKILAYVYVETLLVTPGVISIRRRHP